MFASIITYIIGGSIVLEALVHGEQCILPPTLNCSQNLEQCAESISALSGCNAKRIGTLEEKDKEIDGKFREAYKSFTLKLAMLTTSSEQLDRRLKREDKINEQLISKYKQTEALFQRLSIRNSLCLRRQLRTEDLVFKEIADFRILQNQHSTLLKSNIKALGDKMNKSEETVSKTVVETTKTLTNVTTIVQIAIKQFDMKQKTFIEIIKNKVDRKLLQMNSSTEKEFKSQSQLIASLKKELASLKSKMLKVEQRLQQDGDKFKALEKRILNKFCQTGRTNIGSVYSQSTQHRPQSSTYTRFPKVFNKLPRVSYGIVYLDADSTVRIGTKIRDVSRSGFRVTLSTWYQSRVHGVTVHWMACS